MVWLKDWKTNLLNLLINPLFLLTVAFLVLLSLYTAGQLKFTNAEVIDQAGARKTAVLPFEDSASTTGEYTINATVFMSPLSARKVHIIPDDRVLSIAVNGKDVPLNTIDPAQLGDYARGFILDLKDHLVNGSNQVSVKIYNNGGRYALSITAQENDSMMKALEVLLIILLAVILWRIALALNINKIYPDWVVQALLAALFILAIMMRLAMVDFVTGDYSIFLDWYKYIQTHGGFFALRDNFADYPPAWLYMLLIATWIPLSKTAAIKILIFVFDIIAAVIAALMVNQKDGNRRRPEFAAFAFFAVLFAPTVLMNSSYWGQCDVIFTGLMIGAIYQWIKGNKKMSFVLYGLSFAFKFQAIFLSPFFFILFVKKEAPLRYFFIIPAMYVLSVIPSAIAGRSFIDLLRIYLEQSNMFGALTMGCANFYQWINPSIERAFTPVGMALTVASVLFLTLIVYQSRVKLTKEILIQLALFIVILVPFFLPRMHERYYFAADILSIIYAFYFPKRFYIPVLIGTVSFLCYLPFMMGMEIPIPLPILSLFILLALALVGADLFRSLYPKSKLVRNKRG